MKTMKSAVYNLLAMILLVSAWGCNKNDGNKTPTKASLITASTWKYSSAGIDVDGNGTSDLPLPADSVKACDTNNTLTFKSDGTGIVDEGPTKCNPANPQTIPFSWSLKNNDADLNFSTAIFAGISGDAKILELTSTKLTLSKQITVPGTIFPITIVLFLVH
jgi:hypothetical protein